MKMIYNLANVSNNLLIFTFMASKRFINGDFMQKLSTNYGVINEKDAENFLNEITDLRSKIDSYDKMLEYIGLPELINMEDICANFFRSVITSNRQKYSSLYVPREIYNNYNY
jgi:hypothetical protein